MVIFYLVTAYDIWGRGVMSKYLPQRQNVHFNCTRSDTKLIFKGKSSEDLARLLDKLQSSDTIRYFSCSRKEIDQEKAQLLANAFRENGTITVLRLDHCKINDEVWEKIANSLSGNSTLEKLDISNNKITEGSGIKSLCKFLKNNTSLKTLNMHHNDISDSGIIKLAEALSGNKTLTHLDLSSCKINSVGMCALALILNTTSIKKLSLSGNNIGDEGMGLLAKSLKTNASLEELVISNNNIGDKGAKLLADSLSHNKTLTSLKIGVNNIGDEGAKELACLLRNNETLRELSLGLNNIRDEGGIALAEMLPYTHIESLRLSVDYIKPRIYQIIEEAQRHNVDSSRSSISHASDSSFANFSSSYAGSSVNEGSYISFLDHSDGFRNEKKESKPEIIIMGGDDFIFDN